MTGGYSAHVELQFILGNRSIELGQVAGTTIYPREPNTLRVGDVGTLAVTIDDETFFSRRRVKSVRGRAVEAERLTTGRD